MVGTRIPQREKQQGKFCNHYVQNPDLVGFRARISEQGVRAAFLNQGGSWLRFVIPYRRHSGGRTHKRSETRRFNYRIRKLYRGRRDSAA